MFLLGAPFILSLGGQGAVYESRRLCHLIFRVIPCSFRAFDETSLSLIISIPPYYLLSDRDEGACSRKVRKAYPGCGQGIPRAFSLSCPVFSLSFSLSLSSALTGVCSLVCVCACVSGVLFALWKIGPFRALSSFHYSVVRFRGV